MAIGRLVVVGLGLIGGSVAMALRRANAVQEVVGIGRSSANLERALALGIADRIHTLDAAWTRELADADAVLLATPVAQFAGLFEAMRGRLPAQCVVTDAGSTKGDVIATARARFALHLPWFVPAHPIAGSERSGAEAAFAELFDGREVIVTPHQTTAADALDRVRSLWALCGARVVTMEAAAHDRIFAAVSHLPHLVSAAYLAGLAGRSDSDELFSRAGSGFRDFTRIAAGGPETWRDIALANREALLAELDALRGALASLDGALRSGDARAIEVLFATSRAARERWARLKDTGE